MPFDDDFRRRGRKRGKNSAAMEPADAAREDRLPIEVTLFEQTGGFVGAVVENDRRPHALSAVAIHGGDVRPAHAIVGEIVYRTAERPSRARAR